MIASFLRKATMYRLALYYLAGLLAMGELYGLFGWIAVNPLSLLETTAGLLAVTVAADIAFSKIFRVWSDNESAIITALILALIAGPASITTESARFGAIAMSGIFAIASKYLLAFKRQHVFNPAAAGVFLSSIAFKEFASWWVGQPVLLPAVILGGAVLVWKVRRFRLVAFFLAAYAAMVFGSALVQGLPTGQAAGNVGYVFFHTEAIFLAAVMLTEPKTSPKSFRLQADLRPDRRLLHDSAAERLHGRLVTGAGDDDRQRLRLLRLAQRSPRPDS